MKPVILHLAALLLLVAATACDGGGGALARPETGSASPALQALDLAGDTVSLESLRGSPVLLNLWATWCAPCREETPYLQSLHARLAARGLRVVGVSVDAFGARRDIEEFMSEFGVSYQILHDPSMRSMDIFAVVGLPATFVIGRDGTLLWKHLGPVEAGDDGLEQALEDALTSIDAS
jgi:cytochrome c-type biogenesis protein